MEGRRGDGGEEEVGSRGKRREGEKCSPAITRFIGIFLLHSMYFNSHGSGAFPVLRETPIADKRDDLTNQISVF